ncbi:MAG: hypothetical protein KAT34_21525 [Candidatus Aminicenantes bacterium]|nr:hypothetical protein [Candidatus Aminicenantes bacterium]
MIELKNFVDELKKNKEFTNSFDCEYEKLRVEYLLKKTGANIIQMR